MSIKKKLTSRKLWTAIVGIVAGIAVLFGLDEGAVSTISGAVMSIASVMTYVITEGKVDAQRSAAEASEIAAGANNSKE